MYLLSGFFSGSFDILKLGLARHFRVKVWRSFDAEKGPQRLERVGCVSFEFLVGNMENVVLAIITTQFRHVALFELEVRSERSLTGKKHLEEIRQRTFVFVASDAPVEERKNRQAKTFLAIIIS